MEVEYSYIIVESFVPINLSGKHGQVHIRPLPGQEPFSQDLFVECSKDLSYNYPIGTKFKIKAKIVTKNSGTKFIYSNYKWTYVVLES